MSATLVVETSDLADAAHTLAGRVGDRLCSEVGSALEDAMSCTGMAGDDPAGLSWASAYELAAAGAAQAAEDVINGAFTLSALLAATAQNYMRADAASTTGERHEVDDIVSAMPGPTTVTLGTRFAGVGGGPPNAPFGWSHVEHYVRLIWPNGHQDRLLRAAGAWHRSADALSRHAWDVDVAAVGAIRDSLPEWHDIRAACWSLARHMRGVSDAHRSLARVCEQFAHHLDLAHSELEHEIRVFLIESAAIEVAGNVLSALTFGVAEEPTQEAEAGRISATVAAMVQDLGEFAAAVGELLVALPAVEQVCSTVSTALHELLSVRIVWAEVAGVPALRVLSIARDGRTAAGAADAGGELGAIARLSDDANLPTELRAALDSTRSGEWNNPALLKRHFRAHASDFGAASESDYESCASEFFRRALSERLPTKVDEHGNIRIFDPETNTFGSYTSDGATRTFFKPTSSTYWQRQPGVHAQ